MQQSVPEIVDTHAHLYLDAFDEDIDAVVQRALDAGVKKIYLPNIDEETISLMQDLVARYPGMFFPMAGLHPCSVGADNSKTLQLLADLANAPDIVAIGEIGTDLYWDKTYKEEQERCFRAQIDLAKKLGLPIVIHSRETLDWNISIVSEMYDERLRGVFHCFNGTTDQADRIIEMGFFLGIGGVVTFKNAGLDPVLKALPMTSLVLETDAPYLTPHPHRGKRNESAYLTLVVEKIAQVKGLSQAEVAETTTQNAALLYSRLPKQDSSPDNR